MPRFIMLATVSDDRIPDEGGLRDQTKRIRDALQSDQIQGKVAEISWTVGSCDLVVIAEIPTLEGAATFARVLRDALPARVDTLTVFDHAKVDTATPPVREAIGRPAIGRPAIGRGVDAPAPGDA